MDLAAYIREWEFERIVYWRKLSPGGVNPMHGKPPPFPHRLRSRGLDRIRTGYTSLQKEWIAAYGTPESIGYPT